jgi:hypothetical protein
MVPEVQQEVTELLAQDAPLRCDLDLNGAIGAEIYMMRDGERFDLFSVILPGTPITTH